MCLILFAYHSHPDYKLIVAANRDEFYKRPTKAADFWEDHPSILAGRDMIGKGTWMGINTRGFISMITNYRDPANIKPKAPSRGRLVSDFLMSEPPPQDYLLKLNKVRGAYNGYNLILGKPEDLWYYSNIEGKAKRLGSGVYGLSNHLLNTRWPKVEKGIVQLKKLLKSDDLDRLHELLYDDEIAPDQTLPDTGVGLDMERMLSPMFIKSANYGTRTSTVLKITQEDQVEFTERTYDLNTFEFMDRHYSFRIDGQ